MHVVPEYVPRILNPDRRVVNQHGPADTPFRKMFSPETYAHLFSPRSEAFELASEAFALMIATLVGQSLVTCAWIAGAGTQLRRGIATLMLFLIFFFGTLNCIKFQGLFSACSRGKAAADFGGDDAPAVVLVLCHSVAKFEDLLCRLRLACPRLWWLVTHDVACFRKPLQRVYSPSRPSRPWSLL
jgi:hypothetical protein